MNENEVPGLGAGGISGDIFSTPTTDAFQAVKLLLGNWVDLVFNDTGSDGSATILTQLAGYMNFLAYVFIVVVMSYVLISAVIKTASEGSVLGKGWSAVWLPLRTFLACFLIFPVGIGSAQTISFVQVAIVWLGMVGSNAADRVADFVVDNFQRTAFNLDVTVDSYSNIMRMTEIAFCNEGFNQVPQLNSQFNRPSDIHGQVMTPRVGSYPDNWELHGIANAANAAIGGVAGLGPSILEAQSVAINSSLVNDNYRTVGVGLRGLCGNISVKPIKNETPLAKAIMGIALDTQRLVHYDVIEPVKELNLNATTIEDVLDSPTMSRYDEVLEAVITSSTNLLRLMDQYEQRVGDTLAERMDEGNQFVDFVNQDGVIKASINRDSYGESGWFMIGAYPSIISGSIGQVQGLAGMASNVVTPSGMSNEQGCRIAHKEKGLFKRLTTSADTDDCDFARFNSIYSTINNYTNNMLRAGGDANRMFYASCTDSNNCDDGLISISTAVRLSNSFVSVFENNSAENAQGFINMFDSSGQDMASWGLSNIPNSTETGTGFAPGAFALLDPLTTYSVSMRNVAYEITKIRVGLNFIKAASQATGNNVLLSLNPLVGVIGAIAGILADFILMIITLLQAIVMTGGFLLPLLPSLIWAMVIIGWLLLFIEAVFNAPLAVVLLATPEGEGIMGVRMERKISLIAALILRPTLYVAGLFISIAMMSIGYIIFNQMFWVTAGHTFGSIDPLAIVTMIALWTTIVGSLLAKCLQIIPTFADNSLEWFSGGIAKAFGNNFDNEMSNKLEGMGGQAQNTGALSGSIAGGIAGGVARNSSAKRSVGIFSKK